MHDRNGKLRQVGSLVVVAVIILTSASLGLGCSYLSNPDPPPEYIVSRTKTIFIGTLLQKTFRYQKDEGTKYKIHSLLFRIDEGLKVKEMRSLTVEYWEKLTRIDSCDYEPPDPKVGEQWVVFHGYDEETDGPRNVRHPEFLSWRLDRSENRSQVELNRIREAITSPRSGFYGEVEMAMFDSAPSDDRGIEAELRSSEGNEAIRTAKLRDGLFSFLDLEPGNYVIRLRSPKHEKFFTPKELTMEKSEDGTAFFADFKVSISAKRPEYGNFALAAK